MTALMFDALEALRIHGISPHVVERFTLRTWKALSRRGLIDLYMDADRTYIRNLVLTQIGRRVVGL